MGWFSSACSWVGNAVSSVASAVSRGVSAVYNTAKNMAGKAVEWMAEKAENFVDGVKKTWETIKPYVTQIRVALKAAAAATAYPAAFPAPLLLPRCCKVPITAAPLRRLAA